jgi:hypothetical protein
MAKMGELKRAAAMLGVTSSALRQQGWSTASQERVQKALDDAPEWLVAARGLHSARVSRRLQKRAERRVADRLGIGVRLVREHHVEASEVAALLSSPPTWLLEAQARRAAHLQREQAAARRRADRQKAERELADAYVRAVKDRGDTDAWAAGVLHAAGIHRLDLGDGTIVPVLPPQLTVVR